ncbi:hypothetical protein [Parafrankia elaeagni]|uniref:hypothetical protein n=1 Tax=Parafrankia elaeagni TaxID=222534 RepID=UPI000364B28C|nr:hypothetical protein [Parafrankia elaeagni]
MASIGERDLASIFSGAVLKTEIDFDAVLVKADGGSWTVSSSPGSSRRAPALHRSRVKLSPTAAGDETKDVMRAESRHRRRGQGLLPWAVIAFLATGCALTSAEEQGALVGEVSSLSEERLCVAAEEAAGDCYAADLVVLRSLSVGDCVAVGWVEPAGVDPGTGRELDVRKLAREAGERCG